VTHCRNCKVSENRSAGQPLQQHQLLLVVTYAAGVAGGSEGSQDRQPASALHSVTRSVIHFPPRGN